MLRGTLALVCISVQFLLADLVQRLIIAPLVRLAPGRRDRVLTGWTRVMASGTLATLRWAGGAHFDLRARIPARSGILILMNHQSLMDIPLAFKCLEGDRPEIVTRKRYGRWIPLVSHLLRLDGHPLVEPGKVTQEEIRELAEVAAAGDRPLLVFPEGHRTRDGEIRRFRKTGLRAILGRRRWTVHVIVLDGLRHCARLKDFIRNISSVRARIEAVGPFESPAPDGDIDAFLEEMRNEMCRKLEEIRGSAH